MDRLRRAWLGSECTDTSGNLSLAPTRVARAERPGGGAPLNVGAEHVRAIGAHVVSRYLAP